MQCPYCQASCPDDAMFCGECGRNLRETPPAQQQLPPAEPAPPPFDPQQQGHAAVPPPSSTPYQPANSSGTGPQAILPDEANGFTFAGCVPFGLFGFSHNMAGWGILGCFGTMPFLFPLGLVYFFVIGASGRQMAWKNRQYFSMQNYVDQMRNWNIAGIICMSAVVLYWIIVGFSMAIDPSASTYNILNIIQ